MDWQKQMEEAMSTWTETQRRLWDQWFEAMRGGGAGSGAWEEARATQQRQVEAWQEAVREALERQQQWIGGLSGGAADPTGWATQMQQMMRAWTEAQSELWRNWLERTEKMQPAVRDMPWYRNAQQVLDAWEQAAKQATSATSGDSDSGKQ